MASLEIISLLLGIIGTITGVFSTFLHYWKTREEKPILNVKVLECKHYCRPQQCQLGIEFLINNRGDRNTEVTNIEASFTFEGKTYKQVQYLEACIIGAHLSVRIRELFDFPSMAFKEKHAFTFKLFHTHGVFPFQAESTRTDEGIGWNRQIIY